MAALAAGAHVLRYVIRLPSPFKIGSVAFDAGCVFARKGAAPFVGVTYVARDFEVRAGQREERPSMNVDGVHVAETRGSMAGGAACAQLALMHVEVARGAARGGGAGSVESKPLVAAIAAQFGVAAQDHEGSTPVVIERGVGPGRRPLIDCVTERAFRPRRQRPMGMREPRLCPGLGRQDRHQDGGQRERCSAHTYIRATVPAHPAGSR